MFGVTNPRRAPKSSAIMKPGLFLQRHPLLLQALLWSIPAVLFGAALRVLLLHYSPYAYWGSDSDSYFSFAYNILENGYVSLYDKRRYLYPILLLPVSILPGATLKWVAWLQHGLGLVTILALGYTIRKLFFAWRLWIIPLTALFAGMPLFIWYEHELLGEALFLSSTIWILAGWAAWTKAETRERAARLWWAFFIPLAVFMLTKPAGRFFWPGLFLALGVAAAWRTLDRRHWGALAGLFVLSLTISKDNQSSWLLYNSLFPLTRLDSPANAEYKAEIADMVREARKDLRTHFTSDAENAVFYFLRDPSKQSERPLWQELGRDEAKRTALYKELAFEALLHRPDLFLYISSQRILDSSNPEEFRESRFEATYFADRLEQRKEHAYRKILRKPNLAERLFGFDKAPAMSELRSAIAPRPNSKAAQWLQGWVTTINRWIILTKPPGEAGNSFGLAPLGWLIVVAGLLALVARPFRANLGIWFVAACGYLLGVFLVGISSPRYFAPVWPVLLLLTVVPVDLVIRATIQRKRKG